MRFTRHISASLFVMTVAGFLSGGVLGQTYPNKPIRWINPFGPGGASDIVSRVIAPRLSEVLRQQIVVDNRPGGGTIIATELLANAAPDGYTLMLANISFGANPALHSKLPFDPLKDFAPIVLVDLLPNVLLVHPSVPAKSVQQLIALAKSKPGYLNYGSAGIGSANHLCMEQFKKAVGIDAVHVPYKGGGELVTALLGFQVHVVFITVPPALAHVKAGRVRLLAVTSARRMAAFPDVPTIGETVMPGFVFHDWHGVLAPRGTPKEIIAKLNTEINRVLRISDVDGRITGLGAVIEGGAPAQLADHIKREVGKWLKLMKPID